MLCEVVVGFLVTLFAVELRQFLSVPPQRLRLWILKAGLRSARQRLDILRRCHNSAYFTVLYLARRVIPLLGFILAFLFLVYGEVLSARLDNLELTIAAIRGHMSFEQIEKVLHSVRLANNLVALWLGYGLFDLGMTFLFVLRLGAYEGDEPRLVSHIQSLQGQIESFHNATNTKTASGA